MYEDFRIPFSCPFRPNEGAEGEVLQAGLVFFNPPMLLAKTQPMLSRLLSLQIRQEMAHQGFPGFVAAQIVLRALDHDGQTGQRVSKCLLQAVVELFCTRLIFSPLTVMAQIACYAKEVFLTYQPKMLGP